MFITSIELRNIKSYEKSGRISFSEGINAISGPNGAGKSTILEAIGFTLFDVRRHTQEQFLREGTKSGEIIINLIDALDGRSYQIVRPLGGNDKPHVYDPEIKRILVEGKENVFNWLKEHLLVSPTASLPALFEDAIGVPQGLLTAPFLEGINERKKKFDPLLQVDDYEKTWKLLLETINHHKDCLTAQREKLAGLAGELRRLPDLEAEINSLLSEISQCEKELEQASQQLEQVNAQKAALDELQRHITALEHRQENLTSQATILQQQLTEAQNALQQAEQAQTIVTQSEQGFHAFEAAQKKLDELEEKRSQREALKDQKVELERSIALVQQNINNLEKNLEDIADAEKEVATLQPQVERQQILETAKQEAENAIREAELSKKRLTEEQDHLISLQNELERVRSELELRHHLENELAVVEEQRRKKDEEAAELKAWLQQNQEAQKQLEERYALLQESETAECPLCRQNLSEHLRQQLQEHYRQELQELNEQQDAQRHRLVSIEKELVTIQGKYGEIQARLRELSIPGREVELLAQIVNQQNTMATWQKRLETLKDAESQYENIKDELEKLGDPRSRYLVLKDRIAERSKIEAARAREKQELEALQTKQNDVIVALKDFADLDEQRQAVRQSLEAHQNDHDRYLANLQNAQELPRRRQRVETLEEEQAQVNRDRIATDAELTQARSKYNAEEHQRLNQQQKELNRSQAALEERLSVKQQRREDVQKEVARLRPLQNELQAEQEEYAFSEQLHEQLKYIRETIREAGPHITRQLVQVISNEADRIFGDIMNDYATRLRWSENYEIIIEQGGRERAFSQLSGGEKMAAALAVRLALLHEMSAIRIAFFDEPTAHLDEDRRENLAAQITQIKGFNQLFIISHDDTFERDIYHVLHVTKENGISRVEIG